MKNWNQLFIRQGWLLEEIGENQFYCFGESEENIEFLCACLDKVNAKYQYNETLQKLHLTSQAVTEEKWLDAVNVKFRGRTESIGVFKQDLQVKLLDVYISGIVRQLNRLNLTTLISCDGHDVKPASIYFEKSAKTDVELITNLLKLELPTVRMREQGKFIIFTLGKRSEAHLNLAETLSEIPLEWLSLDIEAIKQKFFNKKLEQLLNIPGCSGEESQIRKEVVATLGAYVDYVTVDHYGNILAEKTVRSGKGPTILLNAHLDVVEEIAKGRTILKDGHIWASSKGILGADDRAGVAVLLEVAKRIQQDTDFSGKVKFIFTVEEEIGLVGARNVEQSFLSGVDAAIVIDRRGTGDIVTSCGGYLPFCHESYGEWIEQIALLEGLDGWKCTPGFYSDTAIWAQQGIESVNLSAGYMNEHTDDESLDVNACYHTYQLVKGIFNHRRSLQTVIRAIAKETSH